tara:strand:- start:5108 stop:5968 length:861 start_codon:yes stop_codon:yes gene_type:complete
MNNKSKYDAIVAVGCSFMHGDNICDINGNFVGNKYRTSKLLSEFFNVPEINLAKSGSSNQRIFRVLNEWIENNSKYINPLIIIGLSGITRFEYFSNFSNRKPLTDNFFDYHPLDFDANQYKEDKNRIEKKNRILGTAYSTREYLKFQKMFVQAFFNIDFLTLQLKSTINYVDGYLSSKNLDFIMFNSIDNYFDLPNKKNYFNFFDKDSKLKIYDADTRSKTKTSNNCWFGYLMHLQNLKSSSSDGFDQIQYRENKPPYGEFFCGSHPSPNGNKILFELLLKQIAKL